MKFVFIYDLWWRIKDENSPLYNVKLYNYNDSNCGNHDVSKCKIVFADNWDKLDWSNTSILSNKEKTGWLSPSGKFYGCDYRNHAIQALLVHHKKEDELEKLGWIKITRDFMRNNLLQAMFVGDAENHSIKPTEQQMKYLMNNPEIDYNYVELELYLYSKEKGKDK
jgi:hypothetical protein